MARLRGEMDDDERAQIERDLADLLLEVEKYDKQDPPDYISREGALFAAQATAWIVGFKTGYRCSAICCERSDHDSESQWASDAQDWPVLYIDLPSGQVSWHMPAYRGRWDGHSTEAKYDRIREWHESLHDGPDAG
jgi:hypothetical protein